MINLSSLMHADVNPFFKAGTKVAGNSPPLEKRTIYYAIACFAVSVFPLVTYLPIWMTLFLIGAGVYRGYLMPHYQWQVPRFFAASAFFVFAVMTYFIYGALWGKDAGGLLFTALYGLKLLETRHRKDYSVFITFSYFLAVLALLFSQSIIMCLMVLFQFVWITYCLLMGHGTPSLFLTKTSPKAFHLLFKILLGALPLIIVLYVFFPRIQKPPGFTLLDGKSGFSDKLAPGSFTRMIADTSPAFRVTFLDGNIPVESELYWRGTILWRTLDGMKWIRGEQREQHQGPFNLITDLKHEALKKQHNQIYHQKIMLMPHYEEWLMALDAPVAISRYSRKYAGGVIAHTDKVRKKMRYEVISVPAFSTQDLSQSLLKKALELPYRTHLSSRIINLVEELRTASSDEAIVQNILNYYKENDFKYSLFPQELPKHALDTFLFENREGYCGHYAASFATLARACGLPTRIVVGFMGGDWNPYGEFMLVRKKHAHVWNEVWLEDQGWVRVDPTSVTHPEYMESNIDNTSTDVEDTLTLNVGAYELEVPMMAWFSKPLEEISARWDQVNAKWDDFLEYDAGRQLSLIEKLGFSSANALLVLLGTLVVTGMASSGIIVYYIFTRKTKDSILQEYEKLKTYLHKRKLAPTHAEGAFTYLSRIQKDLEVSKRNPLERFRDLYLVTRYGNNTDVDTLSQAIVELKSLRKQISRS